MLDSLNIAVNFLDKLDYGNGSSVGIINKELRYSQKEKGFCYIDVPDTTCMALPIIEPFNLENSKRLANIMLFLNKNGIHSIGKRYDGIYCFQYKQISLNINNDFKKSRVIVYIHEEKDTNSNFFNKTIILDRYKNLLLTAPDIYDEPKLPMDRKSILERTEKLTTKEN